MFMPASTDDTKSALRIVQIGICGIDILYQSDILGKSPDVPAIRGLFPMEQPSSSTGDGNATIRSESPQHESEDSESAVVLCFHDKNKTGTNDYNDYDSRLGRRLLACELGLERTWRDVVDFGDPKSSGIGDGWGYKRVSVARVSILDGPRDRDGSEQTHDRHPTDIAQE